MAPETEKPAPVTASEFIVTAVVPDDVRVRTCVDAVFTTTFPNDSAEVLRATPAETPLPLRETTGTPDKSLDTVMVPVTAPFWVGAKVTCTATDWPGASNRGKLAPEIENTAPVIVTEFTVTGAVPDDVKLMVRVTVERTGTAPKSRAVALTESPAAVDAEADRTTVAPHPEMQKVTSNKISARELPQIQDFAPENRV